jgi:segregation and condensation protein A
VAAPDAAGTPPEGAPDSKALRVTLEFFDGPLDLLLHLVRERELDIATVPLAMVAEQYLQYVSLMEALDFELAAEYLVIAATLVFLKSKALLPPIPAEFADADEPSAEEVEERLRRRLITYSRYKEASEALRHRAADAASFYYREAGDPGTEVVQRYRIEPGKLANALLSALRNAKPAPRRSIVRERISLHTAMDRVMRSVRSPDGFEFVAFCAEFDRPSIIVTFLAVLELVRAGRVDFEQEGADGTLRLFARNEVAVAHATT